MRSTGTVEPSLYCARFQYQGAVWSSTTVIVPSDSSHCSSWLLAPSAVEPPAAAVPVVFEPPRTGSVAPHSANPNATTSATAIHTMLRLSMIFSRFVFIVISLLIGSFPVFDCIVFKLCHSFNPFPILPETQQAFQPESRVVYRFQ